MRVLAGMFIIVLWGYNLYNFVNGTMLSYNNTIIACIMSMMVGVYMIIGLKDD